MRVLLTAMLCTLSLAASADEVVMTAVPTSRVVATADTTQRSLMTDTERTKALLLIQKDADGCKWASREGRALIRRDSGAFVSFIDPRGGGYVKVLADKSVAAIVGEECKDGFPYLESLSTGLGTITYWGCAADLAL